MLQRRQTLYLLAVVGFMVALCLCPMVTYLADGVEGTLVAFDYWWIGALFSLCTLLPFVTIWLFKNRMLQVRLLFAEVVLLVGAQIFALWYAIGITGEVKAMSSLAVATIKTPTFFPLIGIILTIMAIRAILKDERLVRSLDRIR
ncbi:MAG: DUF4293 domain-containing protein [Tidjanibacter sp.]|nr:DUF4293 domain-containing protein [Tidjanibacter sp.]